MEDKKATELEIRLRMTKEQVIYELQSLVAYSKDLSAEDLAGICKIFTNADLEEIAEERTAVERCSNLICAKAIVLPKIVPTEVYNPKTDKMEPAPHQHYCGKPCKAAYKQMQAAVQTNIQSHQLSDIEIYHRLIDRWAKRVPRLAELKQQMKDLADKYQKEIQPKAKPEEKEKKKQKQSEIIV